MCSHNIMPVSLYMSIYHGTVQAYKYLRVSTYASLCFTIITTQYECCVCNSANGESEFNFLGLQFLTKFQLEKVMISHYA